MTDLRATPPRALATAAALSLLFLLMLPIAGLFFSTTPQQLWAALDHPLIGPALLLSAKTTLASFTIIILTGTPLAWRLSRTRGLARRILTTAVELPIVLPPAVIGVALLQTLGRNGLLGGTLASLGVSIPFTTAAVVIAQVIVAAPFYVQAATTAFREVDRDLLLVARTLGASPRQAFFRVVVPLCLPALLAGAALSWARAVGEFGATLLFAGNLSGRTQTMPLAIYTALESDVVVAQALALILALIAIGVLVAMGVAPALRHRLTRTRR